MRLAFAALLVLTLAARADPITVTAEPLTGLRTGDYGPLKWRGGLELSSDEENFGGLSGLSFSDDCKSMLAVSDAGRWFRASVDYTHGKLTGINSAELAPMLDSAGKPFKGKVRSDAEALAALGESRYLVGFESRTRVGIYDIGKSGLKARLQLLKSPRDITRGPRNAELESVGRIGDDYFALSESNLDDNGDIKGWLWRAGKTIPFSVKRFEDYAITDAALLPNGDLLILERSYSGFFPGMSVRRINPALITPGATIEPDSIFSGSAAAHAIDNMEGLAVCEMDGETRLSIISDNNFNPRLQRTLLLQFAYPPL